MMLIEQYGNGYSWQIDCGMGQTDGGWIEDGTYSGSCPELLGGYD